MFVSCAHCGYNGSNVGSWCCEPDRTGGVISGFEDPNQRIRDMKLGGFKVRNHGIGFFYFLFFCFFWCFYYLCLVWSPLGFVDGREREKEKQNTTLSIYLVADKERFWYHASRVFFLERASSYFNRGLLSCLLTWRAHRSFLLWFYFFGMTCESSTSWSNNCFLTEQDLTLTV